MDWLTWVLTLFVVAYIVALTAKTAMPLMRYRKAKNRVQRVDGKVVSFYGEETAKRNGEVVQSYYPVYQCEIDNQIISLSGLVRRFGNGVGSFGEEVTLLYDQQTGELWCENDLPLMAKQIKVRLVTITILLAVMILTSVIL